MVHHDIENKKFYTDVEGGEAQILYRELEGGHIDIYSTFVPDTARGKGLAGILTEAAIAYATNNDLKIRPTCPYTAKYFERNPEKATLLLEP